MPPVGTGPGGRRTKRWSMRAGRWPTCCMPRPARSCSPPAAPRRTTWRSSAPSRPSVSATATSSPAPSSTPPSWRPAATSAGAASKPLICPWARTGSWTRRRWRARCGRTPGWSRSWRPTTSSGRFSRSPNWGESRASMARSFTPTPSRPPANCRWTPRLSHGTCSRFRGTNFTVRKALGRSACARASGWSRSSMAAGRRAACAPPRTTWPASSGWDRPQRSPAPKCPATRPGWSICATASSKPSPP